MPFSRPVSRSYIENVIRGKVPNAFFIDKFGKNNDIAAGQPADMWTGGSATAGDQIYDYEGFDLPGEEVMDISSLSGLDVADTGTGAWTMYMEGLNGAYQRIFDIVSLNGTNIVNPTQAYRTVHRAFILTAGVLRSNQGKITINAQTISPVHAPAAIRMAQIDDAGSGVNQTLMGLYTGPANYEGLLWSVFASLSKKNTTTECDIEGYVRPFGGVFANKFTRGLTTTGTSAFDYAFNVPTYIPEKTAIKVRSGDPSASGVAMTGGFGILYEKIDKSIPG